MAKPKPKKVKAKKVKAKKVPTTATIKKVLDDPKQRKELIKSAKAEGKGELAEQLSSKSGREAIVKASAKSELAKHQQQIAEWDRQRKEGQALRAEEIKRLAKIGLVECPVPGSIYALVGLADPKAVPTTQQRHEMAKRLNEVGPKLPRYLGPIGHLIDERKPVASTKAVISVAGNIASGNEFRAAQKDKTINDKFAAAARNKPKKESKVVAAEPSRKKSSKKFDVPKVPKEGFSKTSKPLTSGELIRARIAEHKMTDEQIAAEVRKLFEGRNTKVSDVRWNRGQMRNAGIEAPDPVGDEPPQKKKKS